MEISWVLKEIKKHLFYHLIKLVLEPARLVSTIKQTTH
jgi:hypothetical protein